MKILVTGAAGFIGFHLIRKLILTGHEIIGLDCINSYYDPELKFDRLKELGLDKKNITWKEISSSQTYPNFRFIRCRLEDSKEIEDIFLKEKFDLVCNLAAQAGVRHSLSNPHDYVQSNIKGFLNILEGCRHNGVKRLVYASSSSVYGLNEKMPLSEKDHVDHPISLYAATKRANELMAHSYSHLFELPTIGLRFFTVYGPWGRPDMALFLFTEAILKNKKIDVFNEGNMVRDFTYIDDIVSGICGTLFDDILKAEKHWSVDKKDPSRSKGPFFIFNIGNSKPTTLIDFIHEIERQLGKKATMNLMEMQDGDVKITHSDISQLQKVTNFQPTIGVETGIRNFLNWFKDYYGYSEI